MDRRQEILLSATKSFTLFGYKATTIEQVAKIANVGKENNDNHCSQAAND